MRHRFFPKIWRPDAGGEVWNARQANCASVAIWKLSCMMAVAMLLLPADLHAQTATVIGTITYQNGKPAVNVFISIDGQYRYTDVGGRYKLDSVPQGAQQMTIKNGQTVLLQEQVNIAGATMMVDRVLP
jgi:hypothetical protein